MKTVLDVHAVTKSIRKIELQAGRMQQFNLQTALVETIAELSKLQENKYNKCKPGQIEWCFASTDYSHIFEEHYPEKIQNTFEDLLCRALYNVLAIAAHYEYNLTDFLTVLIEYKRAKANEPFDMYESLH